MTKTDNEVCQDVNDELDWEPGVDASEIEVDAMNGAVTLTGTVRSYSEQWAAETAAMRVHGVQSVRSELKVNLLDSHIREDEAIRSTLQGVIDWSTVLAGSDVSVSVDNGWVTLTGRVKWQYQRTSAAEDVRYLTGVVGLTNDVVLDSPVVAAAVEHEIGHALQRAAAIDAKNIHVEVRGSSVTLTGIVRNSTERRLATASVWAAQGVTTVVDNLVTDW